MELLSHHRPFQELGKNLANSLAPALNQKMATKITKLFHTKMKLFHTKMKNCRYQLKHNCHHRLKISRPRKQPAKSQSSISLLKEYKVQFNRKDQNKTKLIISQCTRQVEKQRPPTPSVPEESEVSLSFQFDHLGNLN